MKRSFLGMLVGLACCSCTITGVPNHNKPMPQPDPQASDEYVPYPYSKPASDAFSWHDLPNKPKNMPVPGEVLSPVPEPNAPTPGAPLPSAPNAQAPTPQSPQAPVNIPVPPAPKPLPPPTVAQTLKAQVQPQYAAPQQPSKPVTHAGVPRSASSVDINIMIPK